MSVYTLKHGQFIGKSADGVPIQVTFGPGVGNFNVGDLEQGMVEALAVYNRGTFLELVEGQQKAVEISIECIQDGVLVGASKPLDMVLKQGALAAATTADPGGVVWTGNATFTATRGGTPVTIQVTNWRMKGGFGEDANGNKVPVSGTAYGTGSTLPVVVS